tara:strand:- start:1892 stop:5785 length:3894 start_codon:yes stop_codon:yes gene_type:complete
MNQSLKFLLKKILIPLGIVFLTLIFVGFVSFYFLIDDNLDSIKTKIFEQVQEKIGHEFTVDSLEADWKIINPSLTLYNVSIFNHDKSQSLNIEKIQADISWLSLIRLSPVFDEIAIHQPVLDIKKGKNGSLFVNGIKVDHEKDTGFSNWLLNQDDIVIYGATISWLDMTKTSEILRLSDLNLHYGSSKLFSYINRRTFNVSTKSSHGTPHKIRLDGYIDISTIANIKTSDGQINISFEELDLETMKLWTEDFSEIKSGNADAVIRLDINNGLIDGINSKLNIDSLTWLTKENKTVIINELSGLIGWRKNKEYSSVKLTELNTNLENGPKFKDAKIELEVDYKNKLRQISLDINRLNLDATNKFIQKLPSSLTNIQTKYSSISPSGVLTNLKLHWEKNKIFSLGTNVLDVSFMPFENTPGISGITGEIKIDNQKGYIKSVSKSIAITDGAIFRGLLEFDQFSGIISWNNNAYNFKDVNIKNNDFQAEIDGDYFHGKQDKRSIDMDVNISNIVISELKKYYPKQLGEKILHWLDTSLLKGVARNTAIKINGKLTDFPFVDENNMPDQGKGLFTVSSSVKNSFIEYGKGWPELDAFDFNIMVNNNYIKLIGLEGNLQGNNIKNMEVIIDSFDIEEPIMKVNVILDSPVNKIINAINNSPLKRSMKGVTKKMVGQGPGELNVSLETPMNDVDNIQFTGTYDFQGSSIQNEEVGIPALENIYGVLEFDNDSISIKKANATLYSSPIGIKLITKSDINQFNVKGIFSSEFIEMVLGSQFSNKIDGQASWSAEINLFDDKSDIQVSSDMLGLSIKSLGTLNKTADESVSFYFSKKSMSKNTEKINFQYGKSITAEIDRERGGDGKFINKVGLISINSPNNIMPKSGVRLIANLDHINVDDYLGFMGDGSDSFLTEASLLIKELNFLSYTVHNASIKYLPTKDPIKYMSQKASTIIKIDSNEVSGNLSWNRNKNLLIAELKKVHLITETKEDSKIVKTMTNPPKLDVKINSLKVDNEDYDYVEFRGGKVDSAWNIDHFLINRGNAPISGDGYWSSESESPQTSINFDWKIPSAEHTLDKLGYPNLIKNGKNGNLTGNLNWDGSPFNFDSNKISGNFLLRIADGTILESEPGVARLFGLLTLQNLPRRLSLDFSDIFRKGFIFDSITANVKADNGILYSDNFKMSGPAAEVLMDGQVSIVDQTQDLHVLVKPRVSDSLSLAALVGGPLVGAAAYIVQKMLKDPLNKILTSEYQLIGTWEEPEEVPVKNSNLKKDLYSDKDSNMFENIIDKTIITPASDILDFLNPL